MKSKLLSLGVLLLLCCAFVNPTYSQIKSDYDKDADFSKIKTYKFAGWVEDSDEAINQIDKKRVLSALKSQFDARGLELVEDNADAVVTLFVSVDQKTSKSSYTTYNNNMGYGGRWGYGYGYGYGGMGTATTTYTETDYNEGTLVLDLYDTETKSLIWQGVITTVVKSKPNKREKDINKKIAKLMKKFPILPES
ncbi:DUF4136 domain-containing protein [Reichenbachiella ulvae]|uniref:DUF4136 domain-containing protein n=1 Tax=Reichenbachiella ulvae TaxID=2980104 RepID=A0ABT3CQW5_9BACT|nr:DUF4136 domain-containing protein [Reichenbachiella ulvae]MCV9385860.1 DUF4136 domain-containing protein [Reichenbachiella ulvae]